jgi:hypothetical protein
MYFTERQQWASVTIRWGKYVLTSWNQVDEGQPRRTDAALSNFFRKPGVLVSFRIDLMSIGNHRDLRRSQAGIMGVSKETGAMCRWSIPFQMIDESPCYEVISCSAHDSQACTRRLTAP